MTEKCGYNSCSFLYKDSPLLNIYDGNDKLDLELHELSTIKERLFVCILGQIYNKT